ncbi:uncharacterized protein LOC125177923 isoform X2 [Hyalella azteca]|uniref:Uncharacterized protein LOC125177923 isoform X2 n=1 Tax=Hyalella azteca TaxID=294128 RepID=A0A979FI11_HYAAZ|nr:uncharacterized protein LOC125177923 isoform X2 [Hyalella azteca]
MDIVPVVEVIETKDSPPSSKKEISTSPTHPLVPTVIQPDGTVADIRRPSIIYPRPSSSRSHRERERHHRNDHFRRSHEVIRSPSGELNDEFGSAICLRPQVLGVRGYSPQRRLTLADALVPRNGKSSTSSPRRHSAADTDNSDVQADLTLEALLIAGSRRNSLRVDERLSRRSSRSSRSSSRRRSSTSRRPRKVSTASAISGVDRYSCNDGSSAPSRFSCHEEEEDEDGEVLRKRAKIARIIGSVAASILLGAILLVALTLNMAPTIDEMVRKENEDILQKWQAGPSSDNVSTVPPSDAAMAQNGTWGVLPPVLPTAAGLMTISSSPVLSARKKRHSVFNSNKLILLLAGKTMSKYQYKSRGFRPRIGRDINSERSALNKNASSAKGTVVNIPFDKLNGIYSLPSSNNTGFSVSSLSSKQNSSVAVRKMLSNLSEISYNSSVSKTN